VTGASRKEVKAGASALYAAVKGLFAPDNAVKPLLLRASPAPIERIRGHWRYEIVLKFRAEDMDAVLPALWDVARGARGGRGATASPRRPAPELAPEPCPRRS